MKWKQWTIWLDAPGPQTKGSEISTVDDSIGICLLLLLTLFGATWLGRAEPTGKFKPKPAAMRRAPLSVGSIDSGAAETDRSW